jgi:DNA-3-methyladenine glycosylase
MGWDGRADGADLVTADRGITILDDGRPVPSPVATGRVGLRVAADRPWRWVVPGSRWASGPAA